MVNFFHNYYVHTRKEIKQGSKKREIECANHALHMSRRIKTDKRGDQINGFHARIITTHINTSPVIILTPFNNKTFLPIAFAVFWRNNGKWIIQQTERWRWRKWTSFLGQKSLCVPNSSGMFRCRLREKSTVWGNGVSCVSVQ